MTTSTTCFFAAFLASLVYVGFWFLMLGEKDIRKLAADRYTWEGHRMENSYSLVWSLFSNLVLYWLLIGCGTFTVIFIALAFIVPEKWFEFKSAILGGTAVGCFLASILITFVKHFLGNKGLREGVTVNDLFGLRS